ncbi:MAG TPA: hypothetical protein VM452_20610 [Caulifigura sp.]|jgi:hypothetical protein|nr:hypothetical protein [Caulifigura sp.]
MPRALIDLMHRLYDHWRFASPGDFFVLGVAIVAAGWLLTRLAPDAAGA